MVHMGITIKDSTYVGNKQFNEYPFILSDFQKHSIEALDNNHNVLVTAPTSCGKTLVAEHLIQMAYHLDKEIIKRKIIYTTPIKALSNCLFNSLSNRFPNIEFGILTGDIKYNPDADCVIMTTEILRNLLYNKKIKTNHIELSIDIDVYKDVYGVIFDEIHYIANRERGGVWEECLILLPNDIQIIGLSATIDHPEKFGKWLMDIKNKPLTLATTYKRVVPLKHYVYMSFLPKLNKVEKNNKDEDMVSLFKNNLVEIMDENGNFNEDIYTNILYLKKKYNKYISYKSVLNDLSIFLKHNHLLPSIMFTLSRKKCEQYAHSIQANLNDDSDKNIAEKMFDKELRKSIHYQSIINMPEYFKIKQLISKGIAYHHSGVYHIFKEVIEKLLSYKDENGNNKPLIKLLFATETFAVGVNIPVKASCYTGIKKYSDDGFRYLKSYEYKQMSGRAGRRGMDKKGVAIIIPNLYELPCPRDMFNIMNGGNQLIHSRFTPNFQFLLKIILTGNHGIMSFIKNSLLDNEIMMEKNKLQEEMNKIEIEIPDIQFDDCLKYDQLLNPKVGPYIKISQKTIKKNKKMANQLMSNKHFVEKYKIYSKIRDTLNKKSSIQRELEYNNSYVHNMILFILEFLQENYYIDKDVHIDEYEKIEPTHITTKGIIASQINECNEILFTELITTNYLDNVSPVELVSILSIFLDTKINGKDDVVNLSNTPLNVDIQNIMYCVENIGKNYHNYMNSNKLYIDVKWNVSFNMVEPVYEWYNGMEFNTLIKTYDLYPGNFVKDMIKLDNIVEDVIKIAIILNKEKLVSTASIIHEKIIRENVNTESLYVNIK